MRPQDYGLMKTHEGQNTLKRLVMKKFNESSRPGFTALHQACLQGDFSFAVKCLEAGANPDAVDDRGHTALRVVCEEVGGSWALVQALLVLYPLLHLHTQIYM
jgi:hypothetical protein